MTGLVYPLPGEPEALEPAGGEAGRARASPLSIASYRSLWIATTAANIGTCMKDVGAGWLMTSLASSPLLVAMVQAATMLPMALLSLPGGALADIIDRRRLLIAAQLWTLGSALALFIVTFVGAMDAALLLALSFATACGSALSIPALHAISSDLVPRRAVAEAVSLAGVSNNIARIVGPAAGGLVIAIAGAEWVFLANGLSVLGIAWLMRRSNDVAAPGCLPPEHLVGAIRAGFRYVHSSSSLHGLMVRAIAFFLGASALWSLLPLLARQQLALGPAGYGLLLTSIGSGAIVSGLSQRHLRRRFTADGLSRTASLLLAAAMLLAGLARGLPLAIPAMLLAGFSWNLMTSSLQSAALLGAAAWVKARAFGIFLMVFNASMVLGALLWGSVATAIGLSGAMILASALLGTGIAAALVYPLIVDAGHDFRPSHHWPRPEPDRALDGEDGPVLVTIEYEVAPEDDNLFVARLTQLRALRLRDGAMRWRYWRDVARQTLFIETFIVASWAEHLRQHDRVTNADHALQREVNALHLGEDPPRVRHWIAVRQ